jgi:hypothetical protein
MELIRGEGGQVSLEKRHVVENLTLTKANALVCNGKWLALGGFNSEGKGVVEMWSQLID